MNFVGTFKVNGNCNSFLQTFVMNNSDVIPNFEDKCVNNEFLLNCIDDNISHIVVRIFISDLSAFCSKKKKTPVIIRFH